MTDIIKTSASAIESFDDSSPFGCQRRWYFKSVMKIPEPPRDNLTLGTNLHHAIERFLEHGAPGELAPDVQRLFHAIKPEVIRVRDEGFIAIEHPIDFLMAPDVRIVGRIDLLRKNGPLDWKTSSDVGAYAPTPWKLARSTQMVTYAQWQWQATAEGPKGPDGLPSQYFDIGVPTQVTHVYVQTKGTPLTQRVDATMNHGLLTEGVSRVINIARQMKSALSLPTADDLKPDRTKCREKTKNPCPYLNICPQEKSTMAISLAALKARLNTTAPMPSAQKAVVDAVKNTVVPTDAPAPAPVEKFMAVPPPRKTPPMPSPVAPKPRAGKIIDMTEGDAKPPFGSTDAERAAMPATVDAPVATSTLPQTVVVTPDGEVATAKRGPGRPPGAKNKKPAETLPEGSTGTGGIAQAVKDLVEKPSITFKTVTVAMTGKLNMGHFQSLDVHVSQTADYTGDPSEAFAKVTELVKKQLDAALENVAGRTVQDDVPPQVLMSTKR